MVAATHRPVLSRTAAAGPQALRLLQTIKKHAEQADNARAMPAGDLTPESVAASDAFGQLTPMTKYLNQRFLSYRSSLLESRLHAVHTEAIENNAKQSDDSRAMGDAAGSSADEGAILQKL